MKIIQFCICLLLVSVISCKADKQIPSESDTMESVENTTSDEVKNTESIDSEAAPKMDVKIDEKALESKMLKAAEKTEVAEVAKVEVKTVTKLIGKSDAEKKKEAEMKEEATKKSIEKSQNKGMSCDQILKDQTKMVNDYMSSKSIDILRKLMAKQNDPFFQECMKSDEFSSAIEALETKMEEM